MKEGLCWVITSIDSAFNSQRCEAKQVFVSLKDGGELNFIELKNIPSLKIRKSANAVGNECR